MYNTFAKIKNLGEQLTGLKIEPLEVKDETWCGNFRCETDKLPVIQIKKEIKKCVRIKAEKEYGLDKKYILLQILLHEICHYKQYQKNNWKPNNDSSVNEIAFNYELKKDYYEKVAYRFAKIYYRRFIK